MPTKVAGPGKRGFRIDEHNPHFTVRNPMMSSGHIVYTIVGTDQQGKFEGQRRYNEFNALYAAIA